MDAFYNPSDLAKIGLMLTGFGCFFFLIGFMMALDSAMLTVGNLLFVAGVALTMGPVRCKHFFLDRRRKRASICFFVGIMLVMLRWCFIGLCIQGFGGLNLFGNFFPMVARVAESTPVIGPLLQHPAAQKVIKVLEGATSQNNAHRNV